MADRICAEEFEIRSRRLIGQRLMHVLGAAGDDAQIRLGRLIWGSAALFPIAQRAEGNAIAGGKLLLRQTESTTNNFGLRRALHAFPIGAGNRARIGIGDGGALDGAVRHCAERLSGFLRGRFPAHVVLPDFRWYGIPVVKSSDGGCGIRFCSGGLQAAIDCCGNTDGALKCAATKAFVAYFVGDSSRGWFGGADYFAEGA